MSHLKTLKVRQEALVCMKMIFLSRPLGPQLGPARSKSPSGLSQSLDSRQEPRVSPALVSGHPPGTDITLLTTDNDSEQL